MGPVRDWPDCQAGSDPTGTGPAEDTIRRRILCKIAENDFGALGETSTLADPAVVDDLIENRMNKG